MPINPYNRYQHDKENIEEWKEYQAEFGKAYFNPRTEERTYEMPNNCYIRKMHKPLRW